MKHAIMVMGYGNPSVLQETINILDDPCIDFVIHWDKKYDLPNLKSRKSTIIFLDNRVKVNWGSDSQIIAEKRLFDYVVNSDKYDYVHLISSSDIPLMTPSYFKKFFKKDSYYLGFIDYMDKNIYSRFSEYYPIRHIRVKYRESIIVLMHYINKFFKVDRLKGQHVEKGCNWFSMDIKYLKEVVNYPKFNMFLHTYTGDEFYVQTILQRLKPSSLTKKYDVYSDRYRMTKSSMMAARYINWFKGTPYLFQKRDAEELKNNVNKNYAFARKILDPVVARAIFSKKISDLF